MGEIEVELVITIKMDGRKATGAIKREMKAGKEESLEKEVLIRMKDKLEKEVMKETSDGQIDVVKDMKHNKKENLLRKKMIEH